MSFSLSAKQKNWLKAAGFLLFIIVILAFLRKYPPELIVETLGFQNSYIIIFLISMFSGVSTFTSLGYFTIIGAFATGGLNIWLMALVAGPGLFIGDMVFYFFGKTVGHVIPEKYTRYLDRFEKITQKKNDWLSPIIIFLYTGTSPFPGDILMVALAVIHYPLRRMVAPLLLGNMLLVITTSLVAIGILRVPGF